MLQYLSMQPITIKNSSGEPIRVKNFRRRIKYANEDLYYTTIVHKEDIRADLLSFRLYKSVFKIGGIIDANDKDVFSFDIGERMRYASSEMIP